MTNLGRILRFLLVQCLVYSSLSAGLSSVDNGSSEPLAEGATEETITKHQTLMDGSNSIQGILPTTKRNLRSRGEASTQFNDNDPIQELNKEESINNAPNQDSTTLDQSNSRRLQAGRARDLRFFTIDFQYNRVIRRPNTRYVHNIFNYNTNNNNPQGGSSSPNRSDYPQSTGSIYFVGARPQSNRRPYTVDFAAASSISGTPQTPYTANTLVIPDPTPRPTMAPVPTFEPTPNPTPVPTTAAPTRSPTRSPTASPTRTPSRNPTRSPTRNPTRAPTRRPSRNPTRSPTRRPSRNPTLRPTN